MKKTIFIPIRFISISISSFSLHRLPLLVIYLNSKLMIGLNIITLTTPAESNSFTQAPIMGSLSLGGLIVAVVDTTAKSECFSFYSEIGDSCFNYLYNSIIGIIKGGFNFWYEQGYMLLCSAFPDKIPPLPGRIPLSFAMVLVYIFNLYLTTMVISSVINVIHKTFKFFCFLFLPYYPHFIIKYLFYFDMVAKKIWYPVLSLRETDKNYNDYIVTYYGIRIKMLSNLFVHIIRCLLVIIVRISIIFITSRGVWAY